MARSLKTGKSKVIGMLVPDITNTFYTEVMEGVEAMARSHGYSVIFCNSQEDPTRELAYLDTLHSHRVDEVVFGCTSCRTNYDRLIRQRFPVVFVDRLPARSSFPCHSVVVDNLLAAHTATNHLVGLGTRESPLSQAE
jgi:DNA-binding LacI/PurR family transcriptional regulator